MTRCRINTIMTALAVLAAPVFADSLDDAIDNIAAAATGMKSVRIKTKFTTDTKVPDYEVHATGTSTIEYKRTTAGGYLFRTEIITKSSQKIQGQASNTQNTTLMIFDGKDQYTLTIVGDQKSAMKMSYDPTANLNPYDRKAVFALLRRTGTLKLLPDESVDGKSCYVIEITVKGPNGSAMISRTLTHYDKKTGIDLKSVTYDQAGNEAVTSTTTDIEINAQISDDRFVFKAPPGVKVIDMSAAQAQAQNNQSGEDAAEDKTAENKPAAKQAEPPKKKTAEKPKKKKKKKGLGGLLKKIKIP